MSDTLHTDLHTDPAPHEPAIDAPIEVGDASAVGSAPMSLDSPSRLPAALAIATTFVLLLVLAFALVTGGADGADDDVVVEPTAAPDLAESPISPEPPVPAAEPPAEPAIQPVPVVPSLPDQAPSPVVDVDIPPVAPPAPSGATPPPPTMPPATPQPVLSVQPNISLDPGVLATTVRVENLGDAPLAYEVTNVGDGFDVDAPTGSVAPADHVDLWLTVDAAPVGDGPTPFLRDVVIESTGGDAEVTVDGQVEKPGHVIADFETVPLTDYRSAVTFTNVGGLPMEIVAVDGPGLRLEPLPDQIAAGESIQVDVAICQDHAPLPVLAPTGQPLQFRAVTWLAIDTGPVGAADDVEPVRAQTTISGTSLGWEPLDCSPVVDPPTDELTLSLG